MADWTTPAPESIDPTAEALLNVSGQITTLAEPQNPARVDTDNADSDSADADDSNVAIDAFGRALVPDWARDAEAEDLTRVLEAVCFSINGPLKVADAAAILGCKLATASAAVDILGAELRERGLMLQRHQDEFQLVTRPVAAWAVQRALNPERPGRLSKAALETLAIVAYRQPVTRGSIEAIRGVNCDAVVDSLERRGLITEVGQQDSPGHPRLFGTTLRFLQIVGLENIEALPALPEGVAVPDLAASAWQAFEADEQLGATSDYGGSVEPGS